MYIKRCGRVNWSRQKFNYHIRIKICLDATNSSSICSALVLAKMTGGEKGTSFMLDICIKRIRQDY
jgi:hypothetical protein